MQYREATSDRLINFWLKKAYLPPIRIPRMWYSNYKCYLELGFVLIGEKSKQPNLIFQFSAY